MVDDSRKPRSRSPPARAAAGTDPRTTAARTLGGLKRAARSCRACDLWAPATQTVFGEGPPDARFMIIGEQAGDREDVAGRPFVGPAGALLGKALDAAGIDRADVYITNVIKHFKFELRGKRRIHQRANAAEIAACVGWLEREIDRVAPHYIVCLGAMAARVMLGGGFRLLSERGRWLELAPQRWCLATVHPAYVLRSRDDFDSAYAAFARDIAQLKRPPAVGR